MIEHALNLPLATIKNDYLLTNVIINDTLDDINQLRQQVNVPDNIGNLVNQMNNESIGQMNFDIINNTVLDSWHNWHNYFNDALQLSDRELNDLQTIYLE